MEPAEHALRSDTLIGLARKAQNLNSSLFRG
jgi:hypothetical protein